MIAELGLNERVTNMPGLRLSDPLGYLDFLSLYSGARLVLTDSGGIQEETTVLGIPCLTLRENTERPITVKIGTNKIVGTDSRKIVDEAFSALDETVKNPSSIPPLWDGQTAQRIIDALT
jgi:UDP-N-acetylglucosamine 2-epimerase (non-hydrolysing)